MKPLPAKPVASLEDMHIQDDPRAWLSALADGEAQALNPACSLWRDDEQARQAWHSYHLIGDVMRSEELATAPARDAAFLAGLRTRLAAEPVVLAPVAPAAPVRRRQPWLLPAAAAAGFVVVAGVLVVARVGMPGAQPGTGVMAGASAPDPRGVRLVSNPVFIRDARLDEYVRAHQSARGGVAVAAPGGTLRPLGASEEARPVSAER